jgi:hypothetical protein
MAGTMLHQLLWIEIVAKLGVGLLALLAPRTLVKVLGLPAADEPFWLRLLGATLIGLAVAMVVELRFMPGHGLGLAGIAAIDLTVASILGALLILGRAGQSRRGRGLLAATAFLLTLISLVAIVSAL